MAKTGQVILAVFAGAVLWAVLWIGGAQAAQAAFPTVLPMGQPVTSNVALVGLIVYSAALSVLAGYVTASIAARDAMPAVWALAVLQLAIGVAVEVSGWNLTPLWYHIVFLGLLVPATVYGGRLRVRRARSAPVLSASR